MIVYRKKEEKNADDMQYSRETEGHGHLPVLASTGPVLAVLASTGQWPNIDRFPERQKGGGLSVEAIFKGGGFQECHGPT